MSLKNQIISSYIYFYFFSIYYGVWSSLKLYGNLFKILKNIKLEKYSHISNKSWDLQFWYRRVYYIRKNFDKNNEYEKPFYEEETNKLNYFNTALGLYTNYNLFFITSGIALIVLQLIFFGYLVNNLFFSIAVAFLLLFSHSMVDQFKCQNYNLLYYIFFPFIFFLFDQGYYLYSSILISLLPGFVGISSLFISGIFHIVFFIYLDFNMNYLYGILGYIIILPNFLKRIFNEQNLKFLFVFWLQNKKEKINYSRKRFNLASLLVFFSYVPFVIMSILFSEKYIFIISVSILICIQIFIVRLFDEQLIDLIFLISSSYIIISSEFNVFVLLSYLIVILKPSYDLFDHKEKKFLKYHEDIQYINTQEIFVLFQKLFDGIKKERVLYFNYHPKKQYYSHFGDQKRWISLFQFLNAVNRIEILPTWDHVFAMKSSTLKKDYDLLWSSNTEDYIESADYHKTRYLLIQENSLNEKKIIKNLKLKYKLVGNLDIKNFSLNKEISGGNFYLFDRKN